MKSIVNLHSSSGIPLCVLGITHRLTFPVEIADHDRRREAMKKQRSRRRETYSAPNQDMGSGRRIQGNLEGIKEGGALDQDLAGDLDEWSFSLMGYTAKAA